MKNTPILVCAKIAFVDWPSTENKLISSFHNFLSFSNYFIKNTLNLCIEKNVVMAILTTGIMQF
jgi:hypothetical protein